MPVQIEKDKITLKLSYDDGMVNGKQKLKSKSYNRISVSANDQDLLDGAKTLASLQSKNLEVISKIETSNLLG